MAGKRWKVIGYCEGVPYWLDETKWHWWACRLARKAMRQRRYSHVAVKEA